MTHHWAGEDDEGGDDFALDLDFTGVEQKEFKPVPANTYRLRIVDAVQKPTNSGGQQISVRYEIISDAKGDDEYKGKTVWDNWQLLPQSRWWMQAALEALTGQPWRDSDLKLRKSDLIDLECAAVVIVDSWKGGDPRNKIKKYIVPESVKNAGSDFSMEPTL